MDVYYGFQQAIHLNQVASSPPDLENIISNVLKRLSVYYDNSMWRGDAGGLFLFALSFRHSSLIFTVY